MNVSWLMLLKKVVALERKKQVQTPEAKEIAMHINGRSSPGS